MGIQRVTMLAMTREELLQAVSEVEWYHRIDLPHGITTPGASTSARRLAAYGIPERLDGKTVLDVGAWDGYWSFLAEQRGAARVLATDSFVWQEIGTRKTGFELARQVLGSRVEDQEIDVMDVSPEAVGGTYDVVLFLGVLYHLKHPLLALERVRSVTGGMLILETLTDMLSTRRPAVAFYPGSEMNADPSNWWGPNPAAIEGMLRTAGFRQVERVSLFPSLLPRIAHAARMKVIRGSRFLPLVRTGRAVFHAWV
jgi:tRNA (mo5U34)-methyltransferase